MSYVGIILTYVLISNFVLTYFLGICPLVGASRSPRSAAGMGLAATFMMSLASLVTWAVRNWLLLPLGVEFLQTLVFVLLIFALGHYLELLIRWASPALYRLVGRFLPVISVNCVVVGIVLIAAQNDYTALESLVAGAAAGAGYLLAAVLISTIREKLQTEWIPRAFRGTPIAFITAGLMALALLAFDQAFLQNIVG